MTAAAALIRCADPDHLQPFDPAGFTAWPRLVGLSQHHGTTPMLYAHLRQAPPGTVPFDLLLALGQSTQALASQSARVAADTREAIALLQQAGLDHIVLKGVALAHCVYPRPELRPLRDADLLIHPWDAERADTLLTGIGYLLQDAEHRNYWLQTGGQWRYCRRNPDGSTSRLELHWHALNSPRLRRRLGLASAQWWSRRAPLPELSPGAMRLAPEVEVVYSALHQVCHHRLGRLLWLCDLRQVLRRAGAAFDWDYLLGLCRPRPTLAAAVFGALWAAEVVLGAGVPTAALAALAPTGLAGWGWRRVVAAAADPRSKGWRTQAWRLIKPGVRLAGRHPAYPVAAACGQER